MSTKKVAAPLERKQPQANLDTPSIAGNPETVKLEIDTFHEFCKANRVLGKDMISVVQVKYPKYDKMIHSKVVHGREYGIQLRHDAMRALQERFDPVQTKPPRREKRTKSARIQARLPDALFAQLQQHLQRSGQTAQDFLEGLVAQFFKPPDNPKE